MRDGNGDSNQTAPQSFTSWNAYWTAQGMPWRTKPEISAERQAYLAARQAIQPDIEQGSYPFKDIKLDRADVEWLLAEHEDGKGPVQWESIAKATTTERARMRKRFDMRGANLMGAQLDRLPLTYLYGGLRQAEWSKATEEQREAAAIHLEGATLREVHLEGAELRAAHFEGANLWHACLQEARMTETHMEGAYLNGAHLNGATLVRTYLGSKTLHEDEWEALQKEHIDIPKRLQPANLQNAYFDESTVLEWPRLVGDDLKSSALLADIRWGNVNLGLVGWEHIAVLGDELDGHKPVAPRGKVRTREERMWARLRTVRTYRQLANTLRQQGINEYADKFAYRAQLVQRAELRREHKYGRWLFSLLLAALSGYGYRLGRILFAYGFFVTLFALLYLFLSSGCAIGSAPQVFASAAHCAPTGHTYTWVEAVVISVTAFHGRVFAESYQPGTPFGIVAAIEAVVGLVIEGVFIALLTQRFFAR